MAKPLPSYTELSQEIWRRSKAHVVTWRWPLIMLFIRIVLFAAFQALIGFTLAAPDKFGAAAAWWPVSVTITNVICVLLLIWLLRREGSSYASFWTFDRRHVKSDLLAVLVVFILAGPIGYLPNLWLGNLLFGSAQNALNLFARPLPLWGALIALIVFPITTGMAELPTYFGYVMPRIHALSGKSWLGLFLPVLMLSLQHLTLPLIFDVRFILWRALMFLPFALLMGLVLRMRPRLFPYLLIGHILIDIATGYLVFSIS